VGRQIALAQEGPGLDVPGLELVGDIAPVEPIAGGRQLRLPGAGCLSLGLDELAQGDREIGVPRLRAGIEKFQGRPDGPVCSRVFPR